MLPLYHDPWFAFRFADDRIIPRFHPEGIRCERDWRCLQLAGPIPFTTVGVLVSLVRPLAETGISMFAISTFDTDYLLVKAADLARAIDAWRKCGHEVG